MSDQLHVIRSRRCSHSEDWYTHSCYSSPVANFVARPDPEESRALQCSRTAEWYAHSLRIPRIVHRAVHICLMAFKTLDHDHHCWKLRICLERMLPSCLCNLACLYVRRRDREKDCACACISCVYLEKPTSISFLFCSLSKELL